MKDKILRLARSWVAKTGTSAASFDACSERLSDDTLRLYFDNDQQRTSICQLYDGYYLCICDDKFLEHINPGSPSGIDRVKYKCDIYVAVHEIVNEILSTVKASGDTYIDIVHEDTNAR